MTPGAVGVVVVVFLLGVDAPVVVDLPAGGARGLGGGPAPGLFPVALVGRGQVAVAALAFGGARAAVAVLAEAWN